MGSEMCIRDRISIDISNEPDETETPGLVTPSPDGGSDSIQRVGDVAHTPRMRGSAGAPPLGEGARSLWAPRGASQGRAPFWDSNQLVDVGARSFVVIEPTPDQARAYERL